MRNPINIHHISRIDLSPNVVDAVVFWTKNPKPMLEKLNLIADYPYYFQFTLNSYSNDIETGLPPKKEIINTFKTLSDKIEPCRVIWRYDPILLNKKYTLSYHIDNFGLLAKDLNGFAEKVTISFIDFYPKITKNINALGIKEISFEDKHNIIKNISGIAQENNFIVDTCAEDIDASGYGVTHASCVDGRLIERIIDCPLKIKKDKNQRAICGCAASVDIGAYNSCANGCLYCYANYSKKNAVENNNKHNPHLPLLIGIAQENDNIVDMPLTTISAIPPQYPRCSLL